MTKVLSMWHMFGKLRKSILESFQIEGVAKSLGDNFQLCFRETGFFY